VTLDPFFLSKFEMTQAQWLRVTGRNPSQHEVGTEFGGKVTTALHPVEFVSRLEAEAWLGKLDLTLPTEAQWEWAVRAGSKTVYATGDEPESLAGAGNLQYGNLYAPEGPLALLLADPWVVHAPAGTFLPSRFGLHDMLGNVKEWCLDPWFGDYHERELRPGDGLVLGQGDGHFAIRGGGWGEGSSECRSSYRTEGRDEWRQPWLGVRPARPLR
jgi:formylglycine-generating enzyme required for sulfatase activity